MLRESVPRLASRRRSQIPPDHGLRIALFVALQQIARHLLQRHTVLLSPILRFGAKLDATILS
jgi:hypothetical protein